MPAGFAFCFLPHEIVTKLHLAALCDCDICRRLALASHSGVLDLVHNIHPVDNLAEDDMFIIQEWRGNSGNKKLAAVAVFAGVSHA